MPVDWTLFIAAFPVRKVSKRNEDVLAFVRHTVGLVEGALTSLGPVPIAVPAPGTPHPKAMKIAQCRTESAAQRIKLTAYERRYNAAGGPESKDLLDDLVSLGEEAALLLDRVRPLLLADGLNPDLTNNPQAKEALDQVVLKEINWGDPSDEDKERAKAALKKRFGLDPEFGLEGQWGKKALPALYKILLKVPESHVFGNDHLKYIDRDMGDAHSRGAVHTIKARNNDQLRLEGIAFFKVKAVDLAHVYLHEQDGVEGGDQLALLDRRVNAFNHYTLHEVGHTVDAKEGFTTSALARGGDANPGAWRRESVRSVVRLMLSLEDSGATLSAAFPDVSAIFIDKALTECLEGHDGVAEAKARFEAMRRAASAPPTQADLVKRKCLADAWDLRVELEAAGHQDDLARVDAVVQRLAGIVHADLTGSSAGVWNPELKGPLTAMATRLVRHGGADRMTTINATVRAFWPMGGMNLGVTADAADPDWDRMRAHAAIKKATFLGQNKMTFYARGNDGAAEATFGGRVTFHSTNGGWLSYDAGARVHKVSDYQFNAPEEWFAELYAVHYAGRLPDGHTHKAWIRGLVGDPL